MDMSLQALISYFLGSCTLPWRFAVSTVRNSDLHGCMTHEENGKFRDLIPSLYATWHINARRSQPQTDPSICKA